MDEQLRVGDAEREQSAAALGEHYVQGRLTADEHAERLDRIWAARTRGELAAVFRDLPVAGAARTPAPQRHPTRATAYRSRRRGCGPVSRGLLVPILVVLVVLTIATPLTPIFAVIVGVLLLAGRRQRWAARR